MLVLAGTAFAAKPPGITGDYLEVRSCDVYTGACVANSEMGLGGREAMLVWNVKQGSWKGIALDGLSVIAVVQTDDTLGDVRYQPRYGKAVIIVDAKADQYQHEALLDFVRTMTGKLTSNVAEVRKASVEVAMGQCASGSCATVKAANLVDISTRCLGGKDHLCGNEENYYPPLTDVKGAFSAYTELAAFKGTGLNLTWELTGKRSAYLGTFAL
jgi:hypothetical protein